MRISKVETDYSLWKPYNYFWSFDWEYPKLKCGGGYPCHVDEFNDEWVKKKIKELMNDFPEARIMIIEDERNKQTKLWGD